MSDKRRGLSRSDLAARFDGLSIFIVFVAIAIRFFLTVNTHRTADELYISIRFAENLASGSGFVYNLGERALDVSPLHVLIMSWAYRFGVDPLLFAKVGVVLADALSCRLLFRVGAFVDRPRAGLIVAAVFAVAPQTVGPAVSGSPTAFASVAGIAAAYALLRRRPLLLGMWAGALALFDLSAVVLAVAMLLMFMRRAPRLGVRASAIFLSISLPWLIVSSLYFHSPLPTYWPASSYTWIGLVVAPLCLFAGLCRKAPEKPIGAVAVPIAILMLGIVFVPVFRARLERDEKQALRLDVSVGHALRSFVQPQELVMTTEIGVLAYYSEARILDPLGRISPQVKPELRNDATDSVVAVLTRFYPRYALLRPEEWTALRNAFSRDYKPANYPYARLFTFPDPSSPPGAPPAFYLLRRTR